MTPKEKAQELIDRVSPHSQYWDCYNDVPLEENHSKALALICVDEIIKMSNTDFWHMSDAYLQKKQVYYREVKNEIEKL